MYLSVYLSICLSVYLSICLSIYLSNCLSVYLSICLSVYLSVYLSIYLSFYLSICLSIYLSKYLSVYLSICLSVYLSIRLSVYLSICLSVYRSIGLSVYLPICLSICLSVCLSICLPFYLQDWKLSYSARVLFFKVDNIKNAAILQDFLIFQSWQHQKWSNSARLPHFSTLTTSKTKQFCGTSSFSELDNIQNEAVLRDFFNLWIWQHQKQMISARLPSKMESWVQSWQPRTNAACDVSSPPVESTVPATRKWCQVIRSAACTCHAKSS